MFHLPTTSHPARELMGDPASLVETLRPERAAQLPALWQARRKALDYLAAVPAARRVCFVVLRGDTAERWLVSFGRKGGWKKEWNFGAGA